MKIGRGDEEKVDQEEAKKILMDDRRLDFRWIRKRPCGVVVVQKLFFLSKPVVQPFS